MTINKPDLNFQDLSAANNSSTASTGMDSKQLQIYMLTSNAITTLFSLGASSGGSNGAPASGAHSLGSSDGGLTAPPPGTPIPSIINPLPNNGSNPTPPPATPAAPVAPVTPVTVGPWDPSALTAQQADREIFGLLAFLHNITGQPASAANTDLINMAVAKLKALVQNSKADPLFANLVGVALTLITNPSSFNAWFSVGNFGDPVTPMLAAMDAWPTPTDAAPADDGTFLFTQISLYDALGSGSIAIASGSAVTESALESRAINFFGHTLSTPQANDTPTTYANFVALYLNSQSSTFSAADVKAVVAALSINTQNSLFAEFTNTLAGFVPVGTNPLPTESFADALTAADAIWNDFKDKTQQAPPVNQDFSNLTAQQLDLQIAGFVALLDRLINNGGSQASIAWAAAKLQAIQNYVPASGNASPDPDFTTILNTALKDYTNPTTFNTWWVFGSSPPGPLSTIFTDMKAFPASGEQAPYSDGSGDDGSTLFATICLFDDFATKNIDQLSNASSLFFGYYHGGLVAFAEHLYARFMVAYLQQQPQLTSDDIASLVGALNFKPAPDPDPRQPGAATFFADIAAYLKTPSKTSYELIQQDASSAWDWFVNEPSQS